MVPAFVVAQFKAWYSELVLGYAARFDPGGEGVFCHCMGSVPTHNH